MTPEQKLQVMYWWAWIRTHRHEKVPPEYIECVKHFTTANLKELLEFVNKLEELTQ